MQPVYAIMITGKDVFHEQLAKLSVESFSKQSYPNKHLVVINDGKYSMDRALAAIKSHTEASIADGTEVRMQHTASTFLGELRNAGIRKVPMNHIWAQWDDDDWHHPEFLTIASNAIRLSGLTALTLQNQVYYVVADNSSVVRHKSSGIAGTIVTRRDTTTPEYSNMPRYEDSVFVSELEDRGQVVFLENAIAPHLYLRFSLKFGASQGSGQLHWWNSWRLPAPSATYLAETLQGYRSLFAQLRSTPTPMHRVVMYKMRREWLVPFLVMLLMATPALLYLYPRARLYRLRAS